MSKPEVGILIRNSKAHKAFLQVEPWANLYRLEPSEELTVVIARSKTGPQFEVEEYEDTTILTLPYSEEFFVVKDGKRFHLSEYRTNVEGW